MPLDAVVPPTGRERAPLERESWKQFRHNCWNRLLKTKFTCEIPKDFCANLEFEMSRLWSGTCGGWSLWAIWDMESGEHGREFELNTTFKHLT